MAPLAANFASLRRIECSTSSAGREIEVRPAFAQQLGYVADVHSGSHQGISWEARKSLSPKHSILP